MNAFLKCTYFLTFRSVILRYFDGIYFDDGIYFNNRVKFDGIYFHDGIYFNDLLLIGKEVL